MHIASQCLQSKLQQLVLANLLCSSLSTEAKAEGERWGRRSQPLQLRLQGKTCRQMSGLRLTPGVIQIGTSHISRMVVSKCDTALYFGIINHGIAQQLCCETGVLVKKGHISLVQMPPRVTDHPYPQALLIHKKWKRYSRNYRLKQNLRNTVSIQYVDRHIVNRAVKLLLCWKGRQRRI